MPNPFFDHPILNSPYECPQWHWDLDSSGQPTQEKKNSRRKAEFVIPITKPKKRKCSAEQDELVLDEGLGLSSKDQNYDLTSRINDVRSQVDTWRNLPPIQWQVTPETQRLLQHWRHHQFSGVRPFFCQVEAVEKAIFLTEVAPKFPARKLILAHLAAANQEANPSLMRLGQKLATGAGKTTVMAEINPEAWAALNSDTSRPFEKPKQGRIALKVINHLRDEVMKVFRVCLEET